MSRTGRHPIFARVFDRISRSMEVEAGQHRDKLLAGLHGRIVEIGAGNGINFAHYPPAVEEVVALEPEPYLRRKAQEAASRTRLRVSVSEGFAAPLPFADASFDAAIASLVLCTVPDPGAALSQLRRVLKPGGELRFMEHVRAAGPPRAVVQEWLDRTRIWPWIGGGCHCSRDTVAAIEAAGFEVRLVRSYAIGPGWTPTNPHVLGVATAPDATGG